MPSITDRMAHSGVRHVPCRSQCWRAVAGLAGLAALGVTPALTQQTGSSTSQPAPWAASQPAAVRMPDATDRMMMQQQAKQTKEAKFEAANAARRKQITDDAALLLQLATELKTAVDKTDKDTLSLDVIRKADAIERLAKGVKEKMKLTVGRTEAAN